MARDIAFKAYLHGVVGGNPHMPCRMGDLRSIRHRLRKLRGFVGSQRSGILSDRTNESLWRLKSDEVCRGRELGKGTHAGSADERP